MPCVLGESQDACLKQTARRGLAQFTTWPTANRLQHACGPAALLKKAQQFYVHLFSWFCSTFLDHVVREARVFGASLPPRTWQQEEVQSLFTAVW